MSRGGGFAIGGFRPLGVDAVADGLVRVVDDFDVVVATPLLLLHALGFFFGGGGFGGGVVVLLLEDHFDTVLVWYSRGRGR